MGKFAVLALTLLVLTFTPACGGGGGGSGDGSASIQVTSWRVYSLWGYWAAEGTVKNNGSKTAKWCKVRVQLTNSAGTIVGSDFGYVKTGNYSLEPGQESIVKLWVTTVSATASVTVRRWVEFDD